MSCHPIHEQPYETSVYLTTRESNSDYPYSPASCIQPDLMRTLEPKTKLDVNSLSYRGIDSEVIHYIDSLQDGHLRCERGGVRVEARCFPADSTGCHFYSATFAKDDRIVLAAGKMNGDLLRSALVKAVIIGALQSYGHAAVAPLRAMEKLNNLLWRLNDILRFPFVSCALLYGVIDHKRHFMEYCNAGHRQILSMLDSSQQPMVLHPTTQVLGTRDSPDHFVSTDVLDLRETGRIVLLAGEHEDNSGMDEGNHDHEQGIALGKQDLSGLDLQTISILTALECDCRAGKVLAGATVLVAEFARSQGNGKADKASGQIPKRISPEPPPDPCTFWG